MVTENSKGMGCLKSQTRTFLGKEHCMKGISGGVWGGGLQKTIYGGVVDIFCNNTLYSHVVMDSVSFLCYPHGLELAKDFVVKQLIVWFQKISKRAPQRVIANSGGGGGLRCQIFVRKV